VIHLPPTFPSLKFKEIVKQADKKWRGFRGGNFLPASRPPSILPAAAGGGLLVISDSASWICGLNSAK